MSSITFHYVKSDHMIRVFHRQRSLFRSAQEMLLPSAWWQRSDCIVCDEAVTFRGQCNRQKKQCNWRQRTPKRFLFLKVTGLLSSRQKSWPCLVSYMFWITLTLLCRSVSTRSFTVLLFFRPMQWVSMWLKLIIYSPNVCHLCWDCAMISSRHTACTITLLWSAF